jgi:hypothetical protein
VELLKAMGMPFHASSLLFVGTTSLLLTLILSVGGIALMLAIPAIALMLIWFTQFTFTLMDDAVNGVKETAPASLEMLSPWGDMRCWVHPVLTVVIGIALAMQPQIPRVPVLIACALLFPASIGAIALTGRAIDAVNPFALIKVMQGLAQYYLLAVLWVVFCVALGVLVASSGLWIFIQVAVLQLLLLLTCAFVGGAVHMRRFELGFEPLVSPERAALREEQDVMAQRQRMIDALYTEVQMRRPVNALATLRQWLEKAAPHRLPDDVKAILGAGASWSETRGFVSLLQELAPLLISMRQPGLAFQAVEAGLAASPVFTLEQESDAVRMIRHALQTGRKRLATTMLANFVDSAANRGTPGAELLELRAQLRNEPAGSLR